MVITRSLYRSIGSSSSISQIIVYREIGFPSACWFIPIFSFHSWSRFQFYRISRSSSADDCVCFFLKWRPDIWSRSSSEQRRPYSPAFFPSLVVIFSIISRDICIKYTLWINTKICKILKISIFFCVYETFDDSRIYYLSSTQLSCKMFKKLFSMEEKLFFLKVLII